MGKITREALRAELARVRVAFDATREGVLLVGPDARIATWNAPLLEVTGVPLALVAARDFAAVQAALHETLVEPERLQRSFEAAIERPDTPTREVLWLRDGRRVACTSHPIEGPSGTSRAWIFSDVTERAEAERERDRLLGEERTARHAVEAARTGASFLAEAGELLASSLESPTTLTRLGDLCVRDLADWCLCDLMEAGALVRKMSAHADPAKRALLQVLGHTFPPTMGGPMPIGRVFTTGRPLKIPDVNEAVLEGFFTDVHHRQMLSELGARSALIVPLVSRGQVLGVLSLISSRPGRRYCDADLQTAMELARRAAVAFDNARLYEQALAAVRLRDDFLMVASHELKTPLTALQLRLHKVLHDVRQVPVDAAQLAVRVESAIGQTERMGALVEQILDVSGLAPGRLSLRREPVDLCRLVTEVVEVFHEALARSGSALTLSLPSALVGNWDRLSLHRVVVNLLSNAIKFGRGNPIALTVEQVPGGARLTVQDHGIGFSSTDRARVFEKFERLVSARQYGGMGLGLYVVRELVDAHGGRIEASGTPAGGARFVVTLPFTSA